jgi:ATP-binding cassette subfamily C protein
MGRGRIIGLLGLMIAGSLLEGVGIALLIPLVGAVAGGLPATGRLALIGEAVHIYGRDRTLIALVLGLLALGALRALVLWQRDMRLNRLSYELVDRWRLRLIHALTSADWESLSRIRRGAVEFSLTQDISRLSQGSDLVLRGAVALVQLVVLTTVGFRLSMPTMSLAVVALLLALVLGGRLLAPAWRHGMALSRLGTTRHRLFGDFLGGLKLAKAHAREASFAAEFTSVSDDIRHRSLAFTNARIRMSCAWQWIAMACAATVLVAGIIGFGVAPAVISALLVLFLRLPGPAIQIARSGQALGAMLPAVAQLTSIEAELGAARQPPVSTMPVAAKPAHVRLAGVSFGHARAEGHLLRNIDLTIHPGELVVLTGASGSGKTTIADLLIGLCSPCSGKLLVDGRPITHEGERIAWRRQIAYVPQDCLLLDRPLRDNLHWVAPQSDDTRIWAALEAAEAADFVKALPEGLETRAGEGGSHFSGGERQRLCLARALLLQPRLLVLDEATSALDPDTERRLLATLGRLRGTTSILMITHRAHPELIADRTVHLAQGGLIES